MDAKILVVDDEAAIADLVEVYLQNEGCTVYKYYTAEEALHCIETEDLDLALLDVMLPGTDGFAICRKIRESHTYPVIMLTARGEEMDKINGLTLGADDYITKPFSIRELMARVKANIRRVAMVGRPADNAGDVLDLGRLVIRRSDSQVTKDGERLELTQREFELLTYLASHAGRVFSRQELMERVWNYEGYVGDVRGVDVAIRRLREKLEDDPGQPKYIITRRGAGYYFQSEL